jgi:hypothetical protein
MDMWRGVVSEPWGLTLRVALGWGFSNVRRGPRWHKSCACCPSIDLERGLKSLEMVPRDISLGGVLGLHKYYWPSRSYNTVCTGVFLFAYMLV